MDIFIKTFIHFSHSSPHVAHHWLKKYFFFRNLTVWNEKLSNIVVLWREDFFLLSCQNSNNLIILLPFCAINSDDIAIFALFKIRWKILKDKVDDFKGDLRELRIMKNLHSRFLIRVNVLRVNKLLSGQKKFFLNFFSNF